MAIEGARLARFIQAWKDFDDEKLVRPPHSADPADDARRRLGRDQDQAVEGQLSGEYAIVVNLLIEARDVLRDYQWNEDDQDDSDNDDVIAMVAKIDAYFKRVDL